MAPSSVGSSPIRHPNILAYPLCLIHSRKGNRLHVGSIPSASTMISEDRKVEAQKLYDKVGNIKVVAKTLHISYEALKKKVYSF